MTGGDYIDFNNVTVVYNEVIGMGNGGGLQSANGNPSLRNSILWYNVAYDGDNIIGNFSTSFSNIEDSGWIYENNISVEPHFCDMENGNYTLNDYSPCLGSGESGQNMGAFGQGCTLELNTFHIHPQGSDEIGDGSADSPFATIQHGIFNANQYDTVYVNSGTYNQSFEYTGKNIVVSGAGVGNTIIDGNGLGGNCTDCGW